MSKINGRRVDNSSTYRIEDQEKYVNSIKKIKPIQQQKLLLSKTKTKSLSQNENLIQIQNPIEVEPGILQDKLQSQQVRSQRMFTPLSEQYPNIIKSLKTIEKDKNIPNENQTSSSYSDDEDYSEEEEASNSSDQEQQASYNLIQQRPNQTVIQDTKTITNNKSQTKGAVQFDAEEEKMFNNLPQPIQHPNHYQISQQKVDIIANQNNRKFILSKEEENKKLQIKLQLMNSNREKIKKYGKQQIMRAHNYEQSFQQKFSWGQNQDREKNQEIKQKQLQEVKVDQQKIKSLQKIERDNVHKQILDLFPESQLKKSKFRAIWNREARSLSRKKKNSPLRDREVGYFSEPERPKQQTSDKKKKNRTQIDNENVINMIKQNAIKLKQDSDVNKLKQKQIKLMKKHKVDYIDKEAKAILSKTKKIPFKQPQRGFENKQIESTLLEQEQNPQLLDDVIKEQYYQEEHIIQIKKQNILLEETKIGQMSKDQHKIFQIKQQKRQQEIDKFKSDLNHQQFKLQAVEPYTKKEKIIKAQMNNDKNLTRQIEVETQKSLKKMGLTVMIPQKVNNQIQNVELGSQILNEAQLTNLYQNAEQVQEEEEGFVDQVQKEIIRQTLKQKKASSKPNDKIVRLQDQAPKKFQPNPQEQMKLYEIQADMPPPFELRKRAQKVKQINQTKIKKVYKSQEPKESKYEPRYPVYHDLGETNLLEEDMYHGLHQVDQLFVTRNQKTDPYMSSDQEEEKEYIIKSGFYKNIIPFNQISQKSVRQDADQSLNQQARSKTVSFQQASGGKSDDSSKFVDAIEFGKNSLANLVDRQRKNVQPQKYTTDDDTDEEYMRYGNQVWNTTDPLNQDIFNLSAKQLMDLPEFQL